MTLDYEAPSFANHCVVHDMGCSSQGRLSAQVVLEHLYPVGYTFTLRLITDLGYWGEFLGSTSNDVLNRTCRWHS